MPFVLHAAWLRSGEPFADGSLFFWAEDSNRSITTEPPLALADRTAVDSSTFAAPTTLATAQLETGTRNSEARLRLVKPLSHPTQISVGQLRAQLITAFPALRAQDLTLTSTTIWLPSQGDAPYTYRKQVQQQLNGNAQSTGQSAPRLRLWQVTGLKLAPVAALRLLGHLDNGRGESLTGDLLFSPLRFANDLLFWSNGAKFVLQLLAGQHYLPTMRMQTPTQLLAGWQPVLTDSQIEAQFNQLVASMPPICRAHDLVTPTEAPLPVELLNHFLTALLDAAIRHWSTDLAAAIQMNEGQTDEPQQSKAQRWLLSLLGAQHTMELPPQPAHQVYQAWRGWSEQLRIIRDANFRICLKLEPPATSQDQLDPTGAAAELGTWTLYYYLQARDHLNLMVPATEVWESQNHALQLGARLLDRPQERLLAGLTVAARIFPPIARSLQVPQPTLAQLNTAEAYKFLQETAPLLENSGFGVILPHWWYTNQRARLGLRLRLMDVDQVDEAYEDGDQYGDEENVQPNNPRAGRGLGLVRYDWELMLGGKALSQREFDRLAARKSPLVRLQDQWIELDPAQVAAAQHFLAQQRATGAIPFLQALRIAQTYSTAGITESGGTAAGSAATNESAMPGAAESAKEQANDHTNMIELLADLLPESTPALLPLDGVDVEGWLADALDRLQHQQNFTSLPEPVGFIGELRPYQRRGVGWLVYLRSLRLGACLADDMGLGKTVQSIALMLYTKQKLGEATPPSLLLCPTSVVANWRREVERFAPTLRVLMHHGSGRLSGDEFLAALANYDLILTSYGTARRDIDLLMQQVWSNLILDEAQNIKNPNAKQTQAVRQLGADNRIALTGTPVENRLAELWSIIEFLNPGYLESYERFRRRYVIPIERYNDEEHAGELRRLVQPFLLRRLKSDPNIIADLPEKNEMVVYCSLTREQAVLYEEVVSKSLQILDQSDGIQRRGMVLALLTKLKQICNHPAHFLKEDGPLVGRSGKLSRLTEMMEEVIAVGDSALVFTQFVEMGDLLQQHLIETLKVDVLFLHGRTPANQRERMVMNFQDAENPTIFILSLRAGGAGLNLTRANHVFHFDRWWNPAVENQATDRAFRIGQRRDVQVHKFVVAGTLEEHIQQLLEDKQTLADVIVGSGEQWLSELSTDQLRDLLLLRQDTDDDE